METKTHWPLGHGSDSLATLLSGSICATLCLLAAALGCADATETIFGLSRALVRTWGLLVCVALAVWAPTLWFFDDRLLRVGLPTPAQPSAIHARILGRIRLGLSLACAALAALLAWQFSREMGLLAAFSLGAFIYSLARCVTPILGWLGFVLRKLVVPWGWLLPLVPIAAALVAWGRPAPVVEHLLLIHVGSSWVWLLLAAILLSLSRPIESYFWTASLGLYHREELLALAYPQETARPARRRRLLFELVRSNPPARRLILALQETASAHRASDWIPRLTGAGIGILTTLLVPSLPAEPLDRAMFAVMVILVPFFGASLASAAWSLFARRGLGTPGLGRHPVPMSLLHLGVSAHILLWIPCFIAVLLLTLRSGDETGRWLRDFAQIGMVFEILLLAFAALVSRARPGSTSQDLGSALRRILPGSVGVVFLVTVVAIGAAVTRPDQLHDASLAAWGLHVLVLPAVVKSGLYLSLPAWTFELAGWTLLALTLAGMLRSWWKRARRTSWRGRLPPSPAASPFATSGRT